MKEIKKSKENLIEENNKELERAYLINDIIIKIDKICKTKKKEGDFYIFI